MLLNGAAANAQAVADAHGPRIEWSPSYLASLGPFELCAITGHEVGHHYLWLRARREVILDALHERLADVVSGWLAGRTGLVPARDGLVALSNVLNLLPHGAYLQAGLRLKDLLQGFSDRNQSAPVLVLIDKP